MRFTTFGALGVVLCATHMVADVTVTVDTGTRYQTIAGIGGANIEQYKVRQGSFYVDADMANHYDSLVYDLGLSETRFHIPDGFTPVTASDEPDWSAMSQILRNVRELAARGMTLYLPDILSPPAYMKSNNSLTEGGYLLEEYYDDFVVFCIELVKGLTDSTGVAPYAFSFQNELLFPEPYGSCIYRPSQYRDLMKIARPMFDSAGLSHVKFYGPEHTVYGAAQSKQFLDAIHDDPQARGTLDFGAVHGYNNDGVTAVDPNASGAASRWELLYETCHARGMPLWMTETSDGKSTLDEWTHNMRFAQRMYSAMAHGKIALWNYNNLSYAREYNKDVPMCNGAPTKLYFTMKQFSRYIRPGAVMTACSSSSAMAPALSYVHPDSGTVTIVLINQDSLVAQTVTVSGSGLAATFERFESSASRDCEHVGQVDIGGALTLPPFSVTTLYATGASAAIGGNAPGHSSRVLPTRHGNVLRAFDLRGRLLRMPQSSRRIAGDVRTRVVEHEDGRAQVMIAR